ncbi:sister chromatid cohesion protein DCC1-like [Musca vetustissima]|uniref:sister chromatid cohesion protein DCC1-like n=1 Tax=Musca vetustissima TaxID=27455 RepID=UPI002AB6467C|nr:sister chromatid cohesion protein DCC1-like [Musca vetustissima]
MAEESYMEVEEPEETLYVRNLDDVKGIIKHAKLDERNLTHITQAIYYPSAEIVSDNLKLLELDDHMIKQIHEGQSLYFKGGHNEKVVLCTDEKTYDVKAAEISNSLLLIPDLKFAAATSTSPLKSPRTANNTSLERSLNDSADDDLLMERTLEQRKILKIFHEYFECREIRPKFRKMGDLLQLTRYSGPEHEEAIDRKLLFTFNQLLDTIQCSRKEFVEGLKQYRAIEFEGWMRVLECEYEYRIVNLMVGLIAENSWPLDEVEREETINALEGIAPKQIVEGLFDVYTIPTEGKENRYTYKEDLVARIVAQNILQPGLKFRVDEFLSTWQEAVPEGMKCDEKYLRGLGIFDKEGAVPCIRSLAEENLPLNIHDRMRMLFKTKPKWTLDEIEPYIECFSTPILSVSQIMAKYARSLMENGVRYYVTKH